MGISTINFVFALPAFYTTDTFGRRNLLLVTFPFLALFQLSSAIAFKLSKGNAQRRLTIAGMYLFNIAYSPGEDPVPFVRFKHVSYVGDLLGLLTSLCRFILRKVCLYTSGISVRPSVSRHTRDSALYSLF